MAGKTFRELAAEATPALTRLIATQDPTSGQPTKSTVEQLFDQIPDTENARLGDMTQGTIKGRAAGAGTGKPTDLTAAQVRTIINVEDGATADQTAAEVSYSNATSGLAAATVQAAIDEIVDETGEGIPAGADGIAGRAASAATLYNIGSGLRAAAGDIEAFTLYSSDQVEIDGASVLLSEQVALGVDADDNMRRVVCYLHNSANQSAAVALEVPWDAEAGWEWIITRGGAYSGAWTIDRETKIIDRAGTTTNLSAVVTGLSATGDLETGITVTGTGIPGSTTIASIDSATQITLSQAATATGTPTLTFDFGKKGTLNGGTSAIAVSTIAGARVRISVEAVDDPADHPAVRIEGDLDATTTLLASLDCNDELVIDALLSGATLNDDLDANGKSITGLLLKINSSVNGTLNVATHSNARNLLNGNVTIPTTAGFFCQLKSDGARTVTFNGTTSPAMAAGDVMSIVVESSTVIDAFLVESASKVVFS